MASALLPRCYRLKRRVPGSTEWSSFVLDGVVGRKSAFMVSKPGSPVTAPKLPVSDAPHIGRSDKFCLHQKLPLQPSCQMTT